MDKLQEENGDIKQKKGNVPKCCLTQEIKSESGENLIPREIPITYMFGVVLSGKC